MQIKQKRVRNLAKYLQGFNANEKLYVALVNIDEHQSRLEQVGFTHKLEIGESVLPAIFRSVTRFNAEGKEKPLKHLPKETAYRQQEWHWTDWGGESHSRIVDVPYLRYPREFIPPPSEELQILKNADGEKVVASKLFVNDGTSSERILHVINLFLEIFGECEILKEDLVPVIPVNIKRLNWQILPQGKYPWEKLSRQVAPVLERAKKGKIPIITARLHVIAEAKPEFVAIGTGGFHGYMVFGFPQKKLYVLESAYYGNATYIFENSWEELSKLTKAEILSGDLQKARLVHREEWVLEINKLLNG